MQQHEKWYAFFLLCISLVGCSSALDFNRGKKLEPRINAFSNAIRWSQFDDAQKFIRRRDEQAENQNLDNLKQIKVTKHQFVKEIHKQNVEQQTLDKVSIYEIEYYIDGSYKIEHLQYEQLWWYDDTISNWFLDSDLPQFKH